MSDAARRSAPAWLIALCLSAVLLGTALRFVNLGDKPYWYDETATSLRVSGYTWEEVDQALSHGMGMPAPALQTFQRPGPAHGVFGTLRGLAVDEPQHPPLYFVLARFWVQVFGNDVATRRLLSALLSLVAFPAVFWLCRELFGDTRTGWVAVALVALSPLHVIYAQEARATALWSVGILLSSAALLRALRQGTGRAWGLYAGCAVLALYTFLFSALLLIAHGVYVRLTAGTHSSQWGAWLRAAGAAALLAAPWYALVVLNQGKVRATTAWTHDGTSPGAFARAWLTNLARPFLDLNEPAPVTGLSPAHAVVYGLIAILLGIGLYRLVQSAPRRIWMFLACLVAISTVPLLVADLVLTGRLSTIQRLQFPTWLGLELIVAWWVGSGIGAEGQAWRRTGWRAALVLVLVTGAISSFAFVRAPIWWNKGSGMPLHLAAAPVINTIPGAVVVLRDRFDVLAFSYLLDPDVSLRRVGRTDSFRPPDGDRAVWLYAPSDELRSRLALTHRLTPSPGVQDLWRVEALPVPAAIPAHE